MNRSKIGISLLAFALAGLVSSCDKAPTADSSNVPAAATEVAPNAEAAPAQPPVAQAPDSAKPEDLKAGLEVMQPRATNSVDAYNKIEILPTSRYFMHPTMEKDASIEFDTTGLSSLTLAPYLGDLNANSDCMAAATAGVVEFSWSLDDGAPVKLTVDRTYTGSVPVEVGNASRLKLAVNQGNGEMSCDWFSVGFMNVVTK